MMLRAFIIIYISLMAGLLHAAQPKIPVTGTQIRAAVTAALELRGLEGTAMVHSARRYYPCEANLKVAPKFKDNWNLLTVTCPDAGGWDITVRTQAQGYDTEDDAAKVELHEVLVLTTAVNRGDVITADMIKMDKTARDPGLGFFNDPDDIIGRRMLKPLGIGHAIQRRHLETDWMIREDEPLMIFSRIGAIEISANGIALENGQFGDIIQVRNLTSGKEIKAIVKNSKKVETFANMN